MRSVGLRRAGLRCVLWIAVAGSITSCSQLSRMVYAPFGPKRSFDRSRLAASLGDRAWEQSPRELASTCFEYANEAFSERALALAHRWATDCLEADPQHLGAIELVRTISRSRAQVHAFRGQLREAIADRQYELALRLERRLYEIGGSASIPAAESGLSVHVVSVPRLLDLAWTALESEFDAHDVSGGAAAMTVSLAHAQSFLDENWDAIAILGLDIEATLRSWQDRIALRHEIDRRVSLAESHEDSAEHRQAFECYREALILGATESSLPSRLYRTRERWVGSVLATIDRAVTREDWATAHRKVRILSRHIEVEPIAKGWSTDEVRARHVAELIEEARGYAERDLPGCALLAALDAARIGTDEDGQIGAEVTRLRGQLVDRPLVSVDLGASVAEELHRSPLIVVRTGVPEYGEERRVRSASDDTGIRRCGTEWHSNPGREADRRRRRELSLRLHELDSLLNEGEPSERVTTARRYAMVERELERLDAQIRASATGRRVTAFRAQPVEAEEHSIEARLALPVEVLRRTSSPEQHCLERTFESTDVAIEADPSRGFAGDVEELPDEEECREQLGRELDLEVRALVEEETRRAIVDCFALAEERARSGDVAVAAELLVRMALTVSLTEDDRRRAAEHLHRWSSRSPEAVGALFGT